MSMQEELAFHLKAFTRIIYFVTEEEDRFLLQFQEAVLLDKKSSAKVYNAVHGLIPLGTLTGDWKNKQHPIDQPTANINQALEVIYKDVAINERRFYVITDPERWLADVQVQRRILNLMHQLRNDTDTVKVLIFVSNRRFIPDKIARYLEVVEDKGLSVEEIEEIVNTIAGKLRLDPPEDPAGIFKGLTSFEIQAALIQSYKRTRSLQASRQLVTYRYKQLKQTDLIQHVDTSEFTFESVGGVERFKKWARRTKASWTPEGRDFGLEPPKGVLAVGVHGTGKSLSVKALGKEWGMPVISLEMGRLKSNQGGESENNVYRATRMADAISPCVLWIDEAEKSLSGGKSSASTDGGVTSRMIGILSTWLQETKSQVCLALTANAVNTLPIEFINRMDERWFFDLPSLEDRIDIMKIHLAKRRQDPARYNLAMLAEKARELVGREIEQCIKAAIAESFEQNKPGLDEEIFVHELVRKPRLVRTMVDEVNETLDWVGYDPDVDDGVRARFAADPKGRDRQMRVV
jgi:AAA+ superfamily predicted ATPase